MCKNLNGAWREIAPEQVACTAKPSAGITTALALVIAKGKGCYNKPETSLPCSYDVAFNLRAD